MERKKKSIAVLELLRTAYGMNLYTAGILLNIAPYTAALFNNIAAVYDACKSRLLYCNGLDL